MYSVLPFRNIGIVSKYPFIIIYHLHNAIQARYDLPQAFGTSAQPIASSDSVKEAVDTALASALSQLPACASLDLAMVSINSKDDAIVDAILVQLSDVLPGSTRVIGWASSEAGAISPSIDGLGTATLGLGQAGGLSITLASLPAVRSCIQSHLTAYPSGV